MNEHPIPPPGTEACNGRVAIRGQTYKCELAPPHTGWAHQNKEAEAIWI